MYENIRLLSTHLKVLGIIFALSIPGACLAIGPAENEDIDPVIGGLALL